MDNGAELITNFEVVKIDQGDCFTVTSADGRQVSAKYVINCAGLFSDKIANMIGDNSFKIGARKGEYILLDKESGDFVNHTLFFCPTKRGKGILVSQTVDNNIILGPTAVEIDDKTDVSTTSEGFANVIESANRLCKKVPVYNSITSFAGIRAYADRHDFIIEKSAVNDKFFNVAGIESPGLTSAPAIGQYVAGEVASDLGLNKKAEFNPNRKADYFFKNLSIEEKNALIKEQPEYGKIICRCESITLGEILRAARENPKATNVDAIKRRTRAGMGRCQGGFCQPVIVDILAKELGIKYEEVTKSGKGSIINIGRTK
jgi:glycerol-3-phosphate dehydrogenase